MVKKSLLLFLITIFICLFFASTVFANNISLKYDGTEVEYSGAIYALNVNNNLITPPIPPIIFNNRAVVPVREVFEALGANVVWDSYSQKINISLDNKTVSMKIGDEYAYIENNSYKLEAPPKIISTNINGVDIGKTMVPIRFVGEKLGMNVNFDQEKSVINISYTKTTPVIQNTTRSVLSYVKYSKNDTTSYINLCFNNKVSYSDFTLDTPNRIVLDIPNVSLDNVSNSTSINDGIISSIRIGESPEKIRVVFDSATDCQYIITPQDTNNVLKITIFKKGTTPAPTATPIPTSRPPQNMLYKDKLVIIDPGHGGIQPGASATNANGQNVDEKDINLAVGLMLCDTLIANGVETLMTRTDDRTVSLTSRPELANTKKAVLFVSIHCNAMDNDSVTNGTIVFYNPNQDTTKYCVSSTAYAQNVQTSLVSSLGLANKNIRDGSSLAVIRGSQMPAILVELGFMTNAYDLSVLINPDNQKKAAQGIAQGILNTLDVLRVPK